MFWILEMQGWATMRFPSFNRLRDTLREIRSYNKLLMGEELLSDQAIALWEDNTTP